MCFVLVIRVTQVWIHGGDGERKMYHDILTEDANDGCFHNSFSQRIIHCIAGKQLHIPILTGDGDGNFR